MRTLIAAVMLALAPLIGQSAESPASLPLLAQAKAAQIDPVGRQGQTCR
ncbi:MAG: hypothetical protein ING52_10890 [Burkholderiales bacterium]|jgi:hypothetical protein|nr:hypothetical protein [Burkholderiales bacterium]MCA3226001.1 hypothetical protein [Burkholderiales bacterium]